MKKSELFKGKRVGKLTVIGDPEVIKGRICVKCKCDCGNEKSIRIDHIEETHTVSCGCVAKEHSRVAGVTHGESRTRLYDIWCEMRRRCNDAKAINYEIYGGRGISVCKEWDDYKTFAEWANSNGYESHLTIDRINSNDNYKPSNCRWATMKEQANNKRNNHFINYFGETKTISQWADTLEVPYGILYARLLKCNYNLGNAIKLV
jgi:hypothetical protein